MGFNVEATQTIAERPNPTAIWVQSKVVPWMRASRYVKTGLASSTTTAPITETAAIMNSNPPNDVGIWAAFSVSNWGNRVPNPRARPDTANVIIAIVRTDTTNMNADTSSRESVTE